MNKKIRFFIGALERGGAETHLLRILPELLKNGWNVDIVVLKSGGILTSEFQRLGIHIVEPSSVIELFEGRFLRYVKLVLLPVWLCGLFLKERQSIVHFFLPAAYLLGGICAWLMRYPSPMLMSRRSLNCYQKKYPLTRKLEAFLHKRMNVILGNSMKVVEQLRMEGVAEDKLKLIYNGFDTSILNSVSKTGKIRQDLGIVADAIVMVKVANLIPYKGHADLLHALAIVKDDLPQHWKLLCVGKDNGILSDLKCLAEELNLSEHIEWLGSRSDVFDILKDSDIGVLCSHEEGFSNAILEYMAAALPVIATDVGGNAEAVLNQVTGYVVESKNVDVISGALLDMAKNRKKRLMMGRNGKNSLIENFSLDHCISEYESVYMKVGR